MGQSSRFFTVEVAHSSRLAGSTKYNLLKMTKMYYDIVTGFSMLPIQIVSYTGFILSVVGFAIGMYLLIWRILFGAGMSGFISFAALGFFFLGILVLAIGLIGEYIARILIEVRGRPNYIIKEMHH